MNRIIFDIETQGLREQALEFAKPFPAFEPLPEFDPASVKVGNLKDQTKITEKIEKARLDYPEQVKAHALEYEIRKTEFEARIISQAALSAITGKVVAIGLDKGEGFEVLAGDEKDILVNFWNIYIESRLKGSSWIGFNITNFDIPFLVRRSYLLRVQVPQIFNGKFLSNYFVDLMNVFACGEYGYRISLDNLCKFLGVEGKYQGDCKGADFADMFLSDDEAKRTMALEYLKCDIAATKAVADVLMPVLKQEPIQEESTALALPCEDPFA